MNKIFTPSQLRWFAVRLFIVPPCVFALAAVMMVVSQAGVVRSTPFLAQIGAGLITMALTAYLLAPAFARLCRWSAVAGCIFGVLICAVGGFAFTFTAALVHSDFSFRDYVLRPIFWFALCGFPVAALTGLFFSGAAQRSTPPAQPHST